MGFILAYCKENQNIAYEIDAKLSLVGIDFDHVAGDEITGDYGLQAQLKNRKEPILLLVSDNFLRSTECMYQALFMLQASEHTNQIQPVVIDGRKRQPDGSYQPVSTTFERVSNVIQYMNYWQERYLDLRKLKREATDSNLLEKLEGQLKIVRSTSSEVGEFLRILRGVDFWTFDQMAHNDFELFFETLDAPNLHQDYQEKIKTTKIVLPEITEEPDPEEFFNGPLPIESVSTVKDEAINLATESAVPNMAQTKEEIPDTQNIETEPPTASEAKTREDISIKQATPSNDASPKVEETLETEDEEDMKIDAVIDQLNVEQVLKNSYRLPDKDPLLDRLLEHQKEKMKEEKNGHHYTNHKDESELDRYLKGLSKNELNKEEDLEKVPKDIIDDIFDDEEEDGKDIFSINEVPHNTTPIVEDVFDSVAEEAVQRAKNLIEKGAIQEGLELLKVLVDRFHNNTSLRFLYATFLASPAEEFDAASIELKRVTQSDPTFLDAYILLASLAEQKEDWLLAKEYYEKILSIDTQQPLIHYRLGKLLHTHFRSQLEQATNCFYQTLQLDPANVDARFQYANLLYDVRGNAKGAVKELESVLSFEPGNSEAYFKLAQILYKIDKRKKASRAYHLSWQFDPALRTEENDRIYQYHKKDKKKRKKKKKNEVVKRPISQDIPFEIADMEVGENGAVLTKTVLITGATSGIGRATAEVFAQHGYRLILTGRRTTRLETIKTIYTKKYNAQIQILPFDVRDPLAVKEAIHDLGEDWQNIDILINNAGLAKGFSSIHEGDLADWEAMIDTNIKGLLYMTRCLAPLMVKRRQGHIINVSSSAGKEVYPNGNVYCATKHAVEALTKAMRLELHKYNIRVGQVSPGHVEETEFAFVRFEDKEKAKIYEDFQPLRASDVAESIYFIATRPPHVNIQDIHLFGTQQANSLFIDRSGRD